jgi:hypothetical protein
MFKIIIIIIFLKGTNSLQVVNVRFRFCQVLHNPGKKIKVIQSSDFFHEIKIFAASKSNVHN